MDLYDMLFQNYITYDRLYAMSSKALYGERVERGEINLFLDLNSFTKRIWYAFPPYEYKNQNVLVASIINACGHYRQYFWTRHMCKTNIYLVWGWNMNPYIPYNNYNAHFHGAVSADMQMGGSIHKMVDSTIEQLKFICPYLPQVYFVDGGMNEVSVVIYNLVRDNEKNIPNIVLSKDVYAYQLVASLPSTFVYRPKKSFVDNTMQDLSWVVTKTNLFKAYRHENGYSQKNRGKEHPSIFYYNFELVLALSGMTGRHVPGACSFNEGCRVLINVLPEAAERNCDIYELGVALSQSGKYAGYDPLNVYNLLSVEVGANFLHGSPEWITMKEGLVDLYNPQGIMELGDKEFVEYPLELGEL